MPTKPPHQTLTASILTVSTTASQDPTTDTCGPLLQSLLTENSTESLTWEVKHTKIVGDDVDAIRGAVGAWADEGVNLVVTTGGTGFAVEDCTPEAVRPMLEKEAVGLVHAMLSSSLKITPFAMMARPVAGVRKSTLIVTLPGSPKGAAENLSAIIQLLPHACIQACGSTSSRVLHSGGTKALEARAGLPPLNQPRQPAAGAHHTCSHGHHAPKPHTANALNGPVTGRHRSSPYPMLSVAEATELIAANTAVMEVVTYPVGPGLVGHVLAEDVTAAEEVPAFRASIVDGYALVHTDGPGTYPVMSVSHAAPGTAQPLLPGQLARITTGAPLPEGATAVVMVEDTVLVRSTDDGAEELEVQVLATLGKGENVREIGSDVEKGSVVLAKGTVVSSVGGEIGVLASVGRAEVRVFRKPVVAVMSTGDEVVNHDAPGGLSAGQIRDSNRPSLLAAIAAAGFTPVDAGIAPDSPAALEDALRAALERADVVVTSGGVSMGEKDLLKATIEQALGGNVHFGRVAMKPGKPTTFATVGNANAQSGIKQFFALPGNPASAIVTAHLFVVPALRRAAGWARPQWPVVRARLGAEVGVDERRVEYHRVRVVVGEGGVLVAWSTGGQRSSRVGSAGGANGVVVVPDRGSVGVDVLGVGTEVEAVLWGAIGME